MITVLSSRCASSDDLGFNGDVEQTMDHNAMRIYQVFHEYGLSNEQIAGMLSNLQCENGIDPTSVEGIYDEPYSMDGPQKSQIANGGEQGLSNWTIQMLTNTYHATYNPSTNTMSGGYVAGGGAVNSSFYGPAASTGLFYCGIGMGSWTGVDNVQKVLAGAQKVGRNWWNFDYQTAALIALPGCGEPPEDVYPRYQTECADASAWECAEWFLTNWERGAGVRVNDHCKYAESWLKRMSAWDTDPGYAKRIINLSERI